MTKNPESRLAKMYYYFFDFKFKVKGKPNLRLPCHYGQ